MTSSETAASVVEAIVAAAERNPAAPAIVAPGRVLSYAQLLRLIAAAAETVRQQGVQPGDVVGLRMSLTLLHLVMMLGIAAAGATSAALSSRSPEVRARVARKLSLSCLFTDDPKMQVDGLRTVLIQELAVDADTPALRPVAVDGAALMRILLTSGTVGEPKGVPITHRQVRAAMAAAAPEYLPGARLLAADLHTSIGFYCALYVLAHGGVLVFPRRPDLAAQVEAIASHAVTHMILSPWAARRLLPLLPKEGMAFPQLRQLRLIGGAPGAELLRELMRRVTPQVYCPYALTELARVTDVSAQELLADASCAGRPGPGVEIRILGPDGVERAAGEQGEIVVRTKNMPSEYVNDPQRSAQRFRRGWFHTGDVGHLSPEGRLHIQGRLDDVINIGGHKLIPEFVEEHLLKFAGVVDAAVFADASGEAVIPVAAVVLEGEVSWQALAQHCLALGPCAPQRFFRTASLPRNDAGKLLRAGLPQQFLR